jgi:5-(carboxyamino)imidazole ribonucleotide synthase
MAILAVMCFTLLCAMPPTPITIGILGAGQLGRMLALAGYPLGLRFRFLDPAPESPAGQLAEQVVAGYDDRAALERFASGLALVTYEFENVPVAAARLLGGLAPVYPPPAALEAAQDRLVEKRFFERLGVPTPPFAPVDDRAGLDAAVAAIGLPAVLKTRRLGYDGKGQAVLRAPEDVEPAWRALGGQPLILEGFVPFSRELSILAVRGRDGATACYPLVENEHRGGILHRSIAAAPGVTPALQATAEEYARRALDALGYAGVLAIELFEVDERGAGPGGAAGAGRRLLVNEMAPRVHNSGHWTIEGAATSQFENHLRATLGLPLGSTAARGHAAMLNLIGVIPEAAPILELPEAHLHLYGKEPRPGRKLGHVTLRADDPLALAERVARVERLLDAKNAADSTDGHR